MKYHKLLFTTAIFLTLAAVFVLVNRLPSEAERNARAAREEARKRGFKFEPSEFVRPLSPEMAARAFAITNVFGGVYPRFPYLKLMEGAGRRAEIRVEVGTNEAERFIATLRPYAATLDAAQKVLLEGRPFRSDVPPSPIRLNDTDPTDMGLTVPFFVRASLDLRAGLVDKAWTNLLAANAAALLVVQPVIYAARHGSFLESARVATWESFQYHVWTDDRLVELSALWAAPDFFEAIEETVICGAYQTLESNTRARTEPPAYYPRLNRIPRLFELAFSEPSAAWNDLRRFFRERGEWEDHVRRDSYIDELIILRHFEHRLATVRRVLELKSWPAMRDAPGVVEPAPQFGINRFSLLGQLHLPLYSGVQSVPGDRSRLIDLIPSINAETTRRLVLAAIAVERARLRLGRLPATLDEAGPVPADFMTGQPFIYRPEVTDTYSIYSPGFDQTDNFGEGDDIAWPRRARTDLLPR